MNENYYVAQKPKLIKDFERASNWYNPHLIERYGQDFACRVQVMARNEYESLIPRIPYIGGSKVHMTSDLLESVLHLAYLRTFKEHGLTLEASRDLVFSSLKTRLAQYPKFLLRFMGWLTFSRSYLRKFQSQARESQKREFPGGFVYKVVTGDCNEFDWGLNFTECGIYKFYQSQGAADFLPLICPIDYILSDAFGYGLVRTKTLAEGAEICNPRMKRGRQTEWRFPDEDRIPYANPR